MNQNSIYDHRAIAKRMKQFIRREDRFNPLPDSAIAAKLRHEGIACNAEVIYYVRGLVDIECAQIRRAFYKQERINELKEKIQRASEASEATEQTKRTGRKTKGKK
jgi:hypothetical protein